MSWFGQVLLPIQVYVFMPKKIKLNGFTLIELLVVVSIVGLLATVVAMTINQSKIKSRDIRRKGDLRQIYTALNLYQSGEGDGIYPSSTEGSWECFDAGSLNVLIANNLMAQLPSDPIMARDSVAHRCYCYKSEDGNHFKIRANLELDADLMINDGGNSNDWYELYTAAGQNY